MRLSVSSKLSALCKIIGIKRSGPLSKSFPTVLLPEYEVAWHKFRKTQMVKDLLAYPDMGRYYACASFVSYISSIDENCWSSHSVNIDELNLPIDLTPVYLRIREFLHLKGFSALRKFKEMTEVYPLNDVDFVRAIVNPEVGGIVTYTPTGRITLDAFLKTLVPAPFKSVPIELTKNRSLNTLLNSTAHWLPLINDDELDLYVGRANLNQLVFKYKIKCRQVLFYGKNNPNALHKQLKKSIKRL